MLRMTRFSYDKLFNLLKEQDKDDWQFAFEVGCTYADIQKMINHRPVSTAVLNRICDHLGVGLGDIMGHEDIRYPDGVRFCDYLHERGFWDDLEDITILEVNFVYHEKNEVDKIEPLHFIVDNVGLSIYDIIEQICSNIRMNPDANPYMAWIVTDRELTVVNSLGGPANPVKLGDVRGYHMTIGYALTFHITDPRCLEENEE